MATYSDEPRGWRGDVLPPAARRNMRASVDVTKDELRDLRWDWMDDAEPLEVTIDKARRGVVGAHHVDHCPPNPGWLLSLGETADRWWDDRSSEQRYAARHWARTGKPARGRKRKAA